MEIPFRVGQEYNRRVELHERFGGSRQSGICPSSKYPLAFLFTGPTGEQHGYVDKFRDDGLFWYTGEGQSGDQKFDKGNLAIRDHEKNGRQLFLFEDTSTGGSYRYLGECVYTGHHIEKRPDRDRKWRDAIVFELALNTQLRSSVDNPSILDKKIADKALSRASLEELRAIAVEGSTDEIGARDIQSRVYLRSKAIKRYALARAKGICEGCGNNAPFQTAKSEPYLEVHHLTRVADGGPDHPSAVAALCPNCHRNAHFGQGRTDFHNQLVEYISAVELTVA